MDYAIWHARSILALVILPILILGAAPPVLAQTGGTCIPVNERGAREMGCFITAREVLDQLPKVPLFWHLDTYPTRVAADAAKGPRGTVVESPGKIWLFTIAELDGDQQAENALRKSGRFPWSRPTNTLRSTWKGCSNQAWRR
jgi:hypothetical protein